MADSLHSIWINKWINSSQMKMIFLGRCAQKATHSFERSVGWLPPERFCCDDLMLTKTTTMCQPLCRCVAESLTANNEGSNDERSVEKKNKVTLPCAIRKVFSVLFSVSGCRLIGFWLTANGVLRTMKFHARTHTGPSVRPETWCERSKTMNLECKRCVRCRSMRLKCKLIDVTPLMIFWLLIVSRRDVKHRRELHKTLQFFMAFSIMRCDLQSELISRRAFRNPRLLRCRKYHSGRDKHRKRFFFFFNKILFNFFTLLFFGYKHKKQNFNKGKQIKNGKFNRFHVRSRRSERWSSAGNFRIHIDIGTSLEECRQIFDEASIGITIDGLWWRRRDLVAADGVDLLLEVAHNFKGEFSAQDLSQVDALVSGNGFVGGQLDAFLDLYKNRNKRRSFISMTMRHLHSGFRHHEESNAMIEPVGWPRLCRQHLLGLGMPM